MTLDLGGLPGFARTLWLVAAKDLRIERRTLESTSSMALFSMCVFVVFSFAFDLATVREVGAAQLVPGVLWTTFAFCAIIGSARSMDLERHRESLSGLLLAPVNRGALFAGKTVASLVTLTVLQAFLVPLSALLFGYDLLRAAGSLALVVTLHTAGLAELGILLGALATRLRRGEALLSILLLPAATPLFLSATRCTQAALRGEPLASVSHWLLVAAGFDMLYFFLALLTFELVLEE